MIPYKVLIVGPTGSGKTYLGRTLDPETTGVINVENKPFSFKSKFTKVETPASYTQCFEALIKLAKDDKVTTIFFDSFSEFLDLLLKQARENYKGFDIWNFYNQEIGKFINLIKKINKNIIITGHYEIINIEGAPEKRLKVKGKEWEGIVEKDFTMVLFADKKIKDNGKFEYFLRLSGEGLSAKCPPHIFGEDTMTIPNDGKFIIDQINLNA